MKIKVGNVSKLKCLTFEDTMRNQCSRGYYTLIFQGYAWPGGETSGENEEGIKHRL